MDEKDSLKHRNYDNFGFLKSLVFKAVPKANECSVVIAWYETVGCDEYIEP